MPTKTETQPEVRRLFRCAYCADTQTTLTHQSEGKIYFKCTGTAEKPGCGHTKSVLDPRRIIRATTGLASQLGLGPDATLASVAEAVERQIGELKRPTKR